MRLTLALRAKNMRYLMKRVQRTKGVMKRPPVTMPAYFKDIGINVVNPNEDFKPKPRFPEWFDPIQDDPQYPIPNKAPEPLEKQENYHEKPIYLFDPKTYLREGLDQALLLTKTHVIEGLPDQVVDNVGKVTFPEQDKLVQRYIMQANLWDPTEEPLHRHRDHNLTPAGWKFKKEYGIPVWKINWNQFRNMIRLCQMLHGVDPELSSSRTLTTRHRNVAHFEGPGGETVQVDGVHNFMVSGTEHMSPFLNENSVRQLSESSTIPQMEPLSPYIDMRKQNLYTLPLENSTGWNASCSKPMYAHTIYSNLYFYWPTEQQLSRCLLHCFASCAATAKQIYGDDVKQLPIPISVQMVGMHVNRLHFLCYQLNTLDLSTDSGVKNMAWIDSDNDLYKKIIPARAMLRNTRYEDYDSDVFKKFVALYLTGAKNVDSLQQRLERNLEKGVFSNSVSEEVETQAAVN